MIFHAYAPPSQISPVTGSLRKGINFAHTATGCSSGLSPDFLIYRTCPGLQEIAEQSLWVTPCSLFSCEKMCKTLNFMPHYRYGGKKLLKRHRFSSSKSLDERHFTRKSSPSVHVYYNHKWIGCQRELFQIESHRAKTQIFVYLVENINVFLGKNATNFYAIP